MEEQGAGYAQLPLENPSFPAGGTARAYQRFPGLSSWKEFPAQGTLVARRRDKPSPAVLTSHSCYQRIRGLWSPFTAAHQGLLGTPLPADSVGGAAPARGWDAALPAAIPLESTLTRLTSAGGLHPPGGADRTGFVPSLQTPSRGIPSPHLSCLHSIFSWRIFQSLLLLQEVGWVLLCTS